MDFDVEKLSFAENEVGIVRLPADTTNEQANAFAKHFTDMWKEHGLQPVLLVFRREGEAFDLSKISEEHMRAHGWVRLQ